MDIVIIADFCGQLDDESNRFIYLAKSLSKNGQKVELITSDFNHARKEHFQSIPQNDCFKITVLHEKSYKRNISFSRLLAHFLWGVEVKHYIERRSIPDVVYCAVPVLTASFFAGEYCRKHEVRFIIDIQDLWPEAFGMVFKNEAFKGIVFTPFRFLSRNIYKNADEIIAVSREYVDFALENNRRKANGYEAYIGIDLDAHDSYLENDLLLKKKNNELWLGYCGTLGTSYDIESVLDALSILSNEAPKFIIMGDGPLEKRFRLYAQRMDVDVVFMGRLQYADMVPILNKCDIAVNPIAKESVASIIGKHADYAAAGLPVINTQRNREYMELIENYSMGFNCNIGDGRDIAEKLEFLLNDQSLRREMSKNARYCAECCFDRKITYKKIMEVIQK